MDEWHGRLLRAGQAPVLWDAKTGWVSAAGLDRLAAASASTLRAIGACRGDRVMILGPTTVEFVAGYLGILRSGMIAVPINQDLTDAELGFVVADAHPAAALVGDVRTARRLAPIPTVTLPTAAATEPQAQAVPIGPADPALICYTSGTTSSPKGVVLSHANLHAGVRALVGAWRWTAADRLVLALPLFHIHGLAAGVHGTLLSGGSAVLLPRFDVDEVLDAAATHRATMFFGVPTMYARLAASDRLAELARLRLCVSGSAPLPAELHRTIGATTGMAVLERYGMSETLMLTSNPYDGERRPGTVGFALPGVELQLRPLDPGEQPTDGKETANAEGPTNEGEIVVRGPNVFAGYLGRPEATAEAFDEDGWFRTGDVGRLDEDGYLRIVGRIKELIITGGENVSPLEVEDVLRRHPAVTDVAVTGVSSDAWGEEVAAFIVSDHPPTLEELRTFAAPYLVAYKRPRRLHVVAELPRNAMGKVQRSRLQPPTS